MCGITGFINLNSAESADETRVKKMADVIAHRGPDAEGYYVEKNVALAHRRLSIIDLNTGAQPMYSTDGNKILIFNGEIYNYIELRGELEKYGYKFRTNSDTEVILSAYDKWGYECQNKFNGMWAFAIWDKTKRELFLSRDRVGEKPMHYGVLNNTFVFGSEIKCLFAFGFPHKVRVELMELYLSLTNIPAPHTFFKDIFKLLPGHYILVKENEFKEFKYWDLPAVDEQNMISNKQDVYENFNHLFSDSVRIRMRSDVPFGAFLSGGLDSSSIVATMARHSRFPVMTFTIGFPDREFDESGLAQQVAEKFKTEHFLGTVAPERISEYLDRVTLHYDEPFGDSSAIPTDMVSKYATRKVKMVLTGDGGDEVLSGYQSYQGIKLSNIIGKMPRFMRRGVPLLSDMAGSILKGNARYKLNRASNIVRTSSLDFDQRMSEKLPSIELKMIKEMCSTLEKQYTIEDYLAQLMSKCRFDNHFYKLMYLNFKHDLPNDYLVKVDRMTMANSLEARLPFLDYRLIEYMYAVDMSVKMQGWERKSVLRNTVGKSLPDALLKAPKKGFGIPLREWFKEDTFSGQIAKSTDTVAKMLDRKAIDKTIAENRSGKKDHGNFIWTLMVLNHVMERQ